ncbi:hypothetical protein [Pseudonocardia xishanensis]|uniref:Uncharacterized protein n=1 Tax=Pseudonocardia xishanensis TaxID=630995 RepID=A0ABP8RXG2_9PSEU
MAGGRTRRARGWWIAVPAAVAVVLGVEFAVLGDRIAADVALVLESGRETRSPAPPDPRPPLPQPAAPQAAGAVREVDLRVLPGCATNAACLVRLRVRVEPGSTSSVAWSVHAEDLCARTGRVVGAGTVHVPAGADRADVVVAVEPPVGPASALTLTTTAPAAAAAPPVRVPAAGVCETRGTP